MGKKNPVTTKEVRKHERIFNSGPHKDLRIISSFLNLNAYLLYIFEFPIAISLRLRNRGMPGWLSR